MRKNCIRKAKPMSRKGIRNIANIVRKWEKCENTFYFDILHFMEITLPKIVPEYTFIVASMEEMGGAHGLTYPDKAIVKIREDVYDRAVDGSGRDRLTIAHELFHLLMHEDSNIIFARGGGDSNIKKYEDPEWQADAFGGELLIPHGLVKGMSATEISHRCGVSLAAANYQMKVG